MGLTYPDGKRFIFSIFDDTDVSTTGNIKPVYDCLLRLQMRTTKSVWPLAYGGRSDYEGSETLEDKGYADYVRTLRDQGFEIAFHGATMVSSYREQTRRALELFRDTVGYYPRTYAAHGSNRENLYWGVDRFTSPVFRKLYSLLSEEEDAYYHGHIENSPYFWGDLCRAHIKYLRGFTFDGINLLRKSRWICYSNERKPWAQYWFVTSDAPNVEEFNRLLSARNQERLEREGGICIISTHFGKGFVKDGKVLGDTERLLEALSRRSGWFVPVCAVLDFLEHQGRIGSIPPRELWKLELKWFANALIRRVKKKKYEKTELEYLSRKEG